MKSSYESMGFFCFQKCKSGSFLAWMKTKNGIHCVDEHFLNMLKRDSP